MFSVLRHADLTLGIFSEHLGIVVELHVYISMYVCVCMSIYVVWALSYTIVFVILIVG